MCAYSDFDICFVEFLLYTVPPTNISLFMMILNVFPPKRFPNNGFQGVGMSIWSFGCEWSIEVSRDLVLSGVNFSFTHLDDTEDAFASRWQIDIE